MNTTKGIFDYMCSFENANISYHQAAECRRYGEEVLAFSMELEENLVRGCDELRNLTYYPGIIRFSKYGNLKNVPLWRCRSTIE